MLGSIMRKGVISLLLIILIILVSGCAQQNQSYPQNNQSETNNIDSLKTEIQSLKNTISQLELELNNSKNEINQLKSQIKILQLQADSSTAYESMRTTLSKPNKIIAQKIALELKLQSSALQKVIESIISNVLESKLPSVTWVKYTITPLPNRIYKTTMKSAFPLEIDTGLPLVGTVTLAKIVVRVSGEVDIKNEVVSNLQVESVTVE